MEATYGSQHEWHWAIFIRITGGTSFITEVWTRALEILRSMGPTLWVRTNKLVSHHKTRMSEISFAWQAKDFDGLVAPVARLTQPTRPTEGSNPEGLPIRGAARPPGSLLKIQFPGPPLQRFRLPSAGTGPGQAIGTPNSTADSEG